MENELLIKLLEQINRTNRVVKDLNDKNDKYGDVDIWSVLPSLASQEMPEMPEMSEVERRKSNIEHFLAQQERTIILPSKKAVKQFEEQVKNLEAYLRGEPANQEAADAFALTLGFNW